MASQGKRMVPEYLIKALEKLFKSDLAVKITVGSIDHITSEDLSSLECGDIVCKEDSTGKHAYVVSYKSEEGICLTYTDASIVETVSYDYTGGEWIYNSTDITPIAEPLMENIVDSAGNKRFIEGVLETKTISGITFGYNKYSLSGTHLMVVLTGGVENGTTLTANQNMAEVELPEWIMNKIYPVLSSYIIDDKTIGMYSPTFTQQSLRLLLRKSEDGKSLIIQQAGAVTLTDDRNFRVQFDLLIDNE